MATSKRLTRRDFLKKSATVAAALAGAIASTAHIEAKAQSVQQIFEDN